MINIVFFGTPHFVLPIPNALISQYPNILISCIVTAPDRPTGRHQTLTSSPIKVWTQKHHIPVLTPKNLDQNFLIQLTQLLNNSITQSLFILAAYGKILPPEILAFPKYGALCIHPSLLPKYRGASPIQAAILSGDKETGVTIIKMDEKMDHGPIVAQVKEPILPTDTSETLHQRLFKIGAELLVKNINKYIKREIKITEQDHQKATFTKILKREDGYIDLNQPPSPEVFERMIRAYHPWPGVWSYLPSRSHLVRGETSQRKIIKFLPGQKIQVEGGKPMGVRDFLNGYPEAKGWLLRLYPVSVILTHP